MAKTWSNPVLISGQLIIVGVLAFLVPSAYGSASDDNAHQKPAASPAALASGGKTESGLAWLGNAYENTIEDDAHEARAKTLLQKIAEVPTTVKGSTTKGCGSSLCDESKVSKIQVWAPIAAGTGIVAAAGVYTGVATAQETLRKNGTQGGGLHSISMQSKDTQSKGMQSQGMQSKGAIKAKGVAVPSDPTLMQPRIVAVEVPPAPQFLAPTATSSPLETGNLWLVGLVGIGCCCLLALLLLACVCGNSKSRRKCTRSVCPDIVSEPEATAERRLPSSYPSRLSRPTHSDVEDAPLLPPGAALPKFWTWLGAW